MNDMMQFPKDIYSFLLDYSFIDDEQVYTNGSLLIPTSRVKQAIEHYFERPKGKWNFIGDQMFECSSCKRAYTQNQFEELRIYTTDDLLTKFCPNCGSYNGGGEDEVSD